jgi:hypothetical protein
MRYLWASALEELQQEVQHVCAYLIVMVAGVGREVEVEACSLEIMSGRQSHGSPREFEDVNALRQHPANPRLPRATILRLFHSIQLDRRNIFTACVPSAIATALRSDANRNRLSRLNIG